MGTIVRLCTGLFCFFRSIMVISMWLKGFFSVCQVDLCFYCEKSQHAQDGVSQCIQQSAAILLH